MPVRADMDTSGDSYGLGLARNYPQSLSRGELESGYYHPSFHFYHQMQDNWVMELAIQFRILYRSSDKDDLALWSLSHFTSKRFRLSYPLFFEAGVAVSYLLPAEKAMIPLRRHGDFEAEVGTGLQIGLLYKASRNTFNAIRIERWRGTATQTFHGLQTSLVWGFNT